MSRGLFIGTVRLTDERELPFTMRARNRKHVAKTLKRILPAGTVMVECLGVTGSEDRKFKRDAQYRLAEFERLTNK